MEKKEIQKQAKKILEQAKSFGVENNFFFTTTFERYLKQLDILNELSKSLDNDGMTVEKEYVKGRKNLYSNPAIGEYNRTVDSANKTVSQLLKIIKSCGKESTKDKDLLMDIINGDGDE